MMDAPTNMTRIIASKRYSTATAQLLASDCFWDGHNFERNGRNTYLYRTPNGAYFTVTVTMWQGERDALTPIDPEEAIALYEGRLSEHEVSYSKAFPNVTVTDA